MTGIVLRRLVDSRTSSLHRPRRSCRSCQRIADAPDALTQRLAPDPLLLEQRAQHVVGRPKPTLTGPQIVAWTESEAPARKAEGRSANE